MKLISGIFYFSAGLLMPGVPGGKTQNGVMPLNKKVPRRLNPFPSSLRLPAPLPPAEMQNESFNDRLLYLICASPDFLQEPENTDNQEEIFEESE